jgi:hypothetical protein
VLRLVLAKGALMQGARGAAERVEGDLCDPHVCCLRCVKAVEPRG